MDNVITCIGSHWIFYTCILMASVLSAIPFLGRFLNVLNTMVHESGHAFMALITGGGVLNIKLSSDTSGAAQTKSKYWIGKVLTSLAGYPVSALFAWLFFWLIHKQHMAYIYYILISLILINLILWVRNTFGILWLIIMGSICVGSYLYGTQVFQYYFISFCSAIVLFQSVYTSITLCIISIKDPGKAGDAKNLREFTYIPAVIWAFSMLAFAIWVLVQVFLLMPCHY